MTDRLIFKTEQQAGANMNKEEAAEMIRLYMENGYRKFKITDNKQQSYIPEILAANYERSDYEISQRLQVAQIKDNTQLNRIFDRQLEDTGLEYFDNYQIPDLYFFENNINMNQFIEDKKSRGLIKHITLEPYMGSESLEKISCKQIADFIQLPLNYLDWNNRVLQSIKCYDIAVKYDKPVIVTNPLKNGMLKNIPPEAEKLICENSQDNPETWAFRFLISKPGIDLIVVNMKDQQQLHDIIKIFNNLKPLDKKEDKILGEVTDIINNANKNNPQIQGCGHSCDTCTSGCQNTYPWGGL